MCTLDVVVGQSQSREVVAEVERRPLLHRNLLAHVKLERVRPGTIR